MHISSFEIIVVLLLFLLLFGAKKLPDAARSIGKALKVFKSEVKDLKQDIDTSDEQK